MAVESRPAITFEALITAGPGEFDCRLEILLASVRGVVREAINRTLGSHFAQPESGGQDVDDLSGEAMLLLVRKLRQLRRDASLEAIQNFPAYAATVASNVCYAYLRRRYPAWTRLKNQVRYVVTHDGHLALQESKTGASCCVLTEPDRSGVGADRAGPSLSLRDLIKTVIRDAGRPVELNDLVRAIADIRGIRDSGPTAPTTISIEGLDDRMADPRPAGSPDHVSFLKQVWEEVRKLPLRQRVALLENLRDDAGRSALALFPLTATASISDIAGALEMPSEELARVWNHLPIDDLRIADRLGVTRQQVINLRKAARARLARRLAAWRS